MAVPIDVGKQKGRTRNEELVEVALCDILSLSSDTLLPQVEREQSRSLSARSITFPLLHFASLAMQLFTARGAARVRCRLAFTMIRVYVARVHVAARWHVCRMHV